MIVIGKRYRWESQGRDIVLTEAGYSLAPSKRIDSCVYDSDLERSWEELAYLTIPIEVNTVAKGWSPRGCVWQIRVDLRGGDYYFLIGARFDGFCFWVRFPALSFTCQLFGAAYLASSCITHSLHTVLGKRQTK